jgi:hypothetical protein
MAPSFAIATDAAKRVVRSSAPGQSSAKAAFAELRTTVDLPGRPRRGTCAATPGPRNERKSVMLSTAVRHPSRRSSGLSTFSRSTKVCADSGEQGEKRLLSGGKHVAFELRSRKAGAEATAGLVSRRSKVWRVSDDRGLALAAADAERGDAAS